MIKNFDGTEYLNTYEKLMSDKNLSLQAKGVYMYLCFSTHRGELIPRSKILEDLNIGKDSLCKYLKELKESGYLNVNQTKQENGRYNYNIYSLSNKEGK